MQFIKHQDKKNEKKAASGPARETVHQARGKASSLSSTPDSASTVKSLNALNLDFPSANWG